MTLQTYHRKRDFNRTPEPKGSHKKIRKKHQLLFLIQKHAASHLHYDFRLEQKGVLLSWAVPKGPSLDPSVKRLAMHVEDHPLEYGSFEGIIPQGQYGGGTVMLWDTGYWEPLDQDPVKAYQQGNMKFLLHGKKLHGEWALIKIKTTKNSWLLIKKTDRYAKSIDECDITKEKPKSVKTKKTMDEIADSYQAVWGKKGLEKPSPKKNKIQSEKKTVKKKLNLDLKTAAFPKRINPELATLVNKIPSSDEWLHEIKLDGYRLIAAKHKGKTRLLTRRNNDWTTYFENIVHAVNALPLQNIILDGEVVVLDEQHKSNFQLLQNSIKEKNHKPFIYYVFDLLYYDQYRLTELSLIERKKILQQLIPIDDNVLHYNDHIIGSGQKVFVEACHLGLEGIVAKNIHSTYMEKRTMDWLKIKCTQRQEFVIGGYTKPQGSRSHFGSLLIGTYNDDKELIYNGNVGTGFTQASLKSIYQLLKKNETTEMPFKKKPPGASKTTWVKPNLIAEIEFTEWTQDNSLRHPSFKGLRMDKKPMNVTRELPKNLSSKKISSKLDKVFSYNISNPSKILYPEDKITKQMIAEYYDAIAQWILPYIVDRPLTLVRCPENYKHCFYQKHINNTTPDTLYGIKIKEKIGSELYIYIKDKKGLMALAQMSALELHPWDSRIEDIEHPDIMIFDLDPALDVPWKKVVAAAFELKELLANLKLQSFVKTTGGKGLHVVIPFKPEYDWETIKAFTKTVAEFMVLQHPKDFIDKMTKAKRTGKIFIDFHRNQRGATAIAPYSTRARTNAPVAVPLAWDELTNNFRDTFFTIDTVMKRLDALKKDPWQDFFKIKQSLKLEKLK